jgi:carboxypeptidase family protein
MVLAVAVAISALLCLEGSAAPKQAEVKGTVTDTSGAGILGASVAFARGGQSVTVKTDSYGTYRALLEAGSYEVSVKASGFYEMRRGPFILREGTDTKFDFQLVDVVISDRVVPADSSRPRTALRDPYNYQEQRLDVIAPNGLRPLVLFGGREERAGSVTYAGLLRDGKRLPVVYTYDLLTVRCETLTYFPKDGSVQGTGNVVFEDGERTQRGSKIEISFRDGKPEARLSE